MIFSVNSLVHVRDEKVSLYRYTYAELISQQPIEQFSVFGGGFRLPSEKVCLVNPHLSGKGSFNKILILIYSSCTPESFFISCLAEDFCLTFIRLCQPLKNGCHAQRAMTAAILSVSLLTIRQSVRRFRFHSV